MLHQLFLNTNKNKIPHNNIIQTKCLSSQTVKLWSCQFDDDCISNLFIFKILYFIFKVKEVTNFLYIKYLILNEANLY